MFTLRRPRRWTTWLAMWVLVLNAFAPLVAQAAVANQQGGHWFEVCTSTGMVRVQADASHGDAQLPSSGGEFNLGQHCPACTVHDLALGLPPAALVVFAAGSTCAQPAPVAWAARDNRVAQAAAARAPPLN